MEKTNIYEIAKIANVSHMTVSRAFNNPELVSTKTRDKILQIAEKYNFKPSMIAKSMRTKKSSYIAFIFQDMTNPVSQEMVKGVDNCVQEYGYNLIISINEYNYEKQNSALEMLFSKGVDGIILNGLDGDKSDREAIKKMKENNIPYVLLDKFVPGTESSYVVIDNLRASYAAVDYMIKLGHRKIAFISSPLISINNERLKGYKQALADNKIDFDNALVFVEGKEDIQSGYSASTKLFSQFKDVTAIFSICDFMALGIYQYCNEKKIAIPKDISIASIDDIYVSSLISPPLTTVYQNKYKLGYTATEILMKSINNNKKPVKKVILDTELIIRNSCRRIN